jgi:hypothetical protein
LSILYTVKVIISSPLIRKGIFPDRYAPGTEKDLIPRVVLFEKYHRLFQDVRSDSGVPLLARFQQGADPRERPVGSAKPIYGVESHGREYSKGNAKGMPRKM